MFNIGKFFGRGDVVAADEYDYSKDEAEAKPNQSRPANVANVFVVDKSGKKVPLKEHKEQVARKDEQEIAKVQKSIATGESLETDENDIEDENSASAEKAFGRIFNLESEDLKSIEGFDDLSEGQKLFVLENLRQITLGKVKEGGEAEYEKQTAAIMRGESDFGKTPPWIKRNIPTFLKVGALAMNNLTKSFKIAGNEKRLASELMQGGIKEHGEALRLLVEGMKDGPEVSVKDGRPEIQFASLERWNREGEKEVAENFNASATAFMRLPKEWNYNNATAEQKKNYEEAELNYREAKEKYLALESVYFGEKWACQDLNSVDAKIAINQLLNQNPEAEEELIRISGQNELWRGAVNSLKASRGRGISMSAGFAIRGLAFSTAGAVGSFIAAPLVGGAIGAWRGREKGKKDIEKQDKKARIGLGEADAKAENFVPAVHLLKRLKSLADEYQAAVDQGKFAKAAQVMMILNTRIDYTEEKINNGLVDFGTEFDYSVLSKSDQAKFFSEEERRQGVLGRQFELVQELCQAKALATKVNLKAEDDILRKRLDSWMENNEERVDESRREYVKKQIISGAVKCAGFALAGAAFRDVAGDWFGWNKKTGSVLKAGFKGVKEGLRGANTVVAAEAILDDSSQTNVGLPTQADTENLAAGKMENVNATVQEDIKKPSISKGMAAGNINNLDQALDKNNGESIISMAKKIDIAPTTENTVDLGSPEDVKAFLAEPGNKETLAKLSAKAERFFDFKVPQAERNAIGDELTSMKAALEKELGARMGFDLDGDVTLHYPDGHSLKVLEGNGRNFVTEKFLAESPMVEEELPVASAPLVETKEIADMEVAEKAIKDFMVPFENEAKVFQLSQLLRDREEHLFKGSFNRQIEALTNDIEKATNAKIVYGEDRSILLKAATGDTYKILDGLSDHTVDIRVPLIAEMEHKGPSMDDVLEAKNKEIIAAANRFHEPGAPAVETAQADPTPETPAVETASAAPIESIDQSVSEEVDFGTALEDESASPLAEEGVQDVPAAEAPVATPEEAIVEPAQAPEDLSTAEDVPVQELAAAKIVPAEAFQVLDTNPLADFPQKELVFADNFPAADRANFEKYFKSSLAERNEIVKQLADWKNQFGDRPQYADFEGRVKKLLDRENGLLENMVRAAYTGENNIEVKTISIGDVNPANVADMQLDGLAQLSHLRTIDEASSDAFSELDRAREAVSRAAGVKPEEADFSNEAPVAAPEEAIVEPAQAPEDLSTAENVPVQEVAAANIVPAEAFQVLDTNPLADFPQKELVFADNFPAADRANFEKYFKSHLEQRNEIVKQLADWKNQFGDRPQYADFEGRVKKLLDRENKFLKDMFTDAYLGRKIEVLPAGEFDNVRAADMQLDDLARASRLQNSSDAYSELHRARRTSSRATIVSPENAVFPKDVSGAESFKPLDEATPESPTTMTLAEAKSFDKPLNSVELAKNLAEQGRHINLRNVPSVSHEVLLAWQNEDRTFNLLGLKPELLDKESIEILSHFKRPPILSDEVLIKIDNKI